MSDIGKKLKLKKEVINNQTLDEDIKNNIKQVMKKEYEKNDDNIKEKHKLPIWKKVLVTAACVLIVSSATFAGNIGDFITNIFKNTEMNTDQIIKPENIIEINSEYVTCNGISLNVGYLYEDDDYLYVAMNVRGIDDDVVEIMIEQFEIDDATNNVKLINTELNNYMSYKLQYKADSKIIFLKIEKNKNINLNNKLILLIDKLFIKEKKFVNFNYIEGEWKFKLEKP